MTSLPALLEELKALGEKASPAPWGWRELGGRLMLVTLHSGAQVVLSCGRNGALQTRDKNGTLRDLEADHPVAALIVALVNALPEIIKGVTDMAGERDTAATNAVNLGLKLAIAEASLAKLRAEMDEAVLVIGLLDNAFVNLDRTTPLSQSQIAACIAMNAFRGETKPETLSRKDDRA